MGIRQSSKSACLDCVTGKIEQRARQKRVAAKNKAPVASRDARVSWQRRGDLQMQASLPNEAPDLFARDLLQSPSASLC